MRLLNVFAAASGAAALVMLATTHHLRGDADYSFVLLAGLVQLSAAAAGLAIANRAGRLNAIGGGLIVAGAALFAGEITLSAYHFHALGLLAPIGGGMSIAGWIVLAFAKPGASAP
jgi:uncharacterized membrane protein YgdD (TMEM256/DUF423 family)